MEDITQEDIERLDRIVQVFNCELCLPPYKSANNTFIPIDHIKNNYDIYDLTAILVEKGFVMKYDNDCIEILGINNG